jgi:hypothetical protein
MDGPKGPGQGLPSDPIVQALARFIAALDDRYPDGPGALPSSRLASAADTRNMRSVSDPERRPAV